MEVVLIIVAILVVALLAVGGLVYARRTTGPIEPEVEAPPRVLEAPPEVVEAPPERVPPRLRDRLGKARALLAGYFGDLRSRDRIDDEAWDELEEALIRADVGVTATQRILDEVRARVKETG